ncbi:MAG TPA: hypothetical protein VM737_02735 [Gemmatimonadota bacterium]|nr:hypothetical protein [Gemmatimonadota bacterium]
MSIRSLPFVRTGLALFLGLLLTAPVLAGPPWISIEIPANPHDRATRGALLVVHAYHHGDNVAYPLTGTAEGLVDGKRVSLPLSITRTGSAGVYAVAPPDLPAGSWILVLRLAAGEGSGATALVRLDGRGEIAGVRVPSDSREGWTIPRPVTGGEIDDLLQRGGLASTDGPSASALAAGFGATILVPFVLFRLHRRRGEGR